MPCWIDYVTADPPAARRFYGALFGWTFAPERPDYDIVRCRGEIVGGLGRAPRPKHPAGWTTYLASKDLRATALHARAAGAHIVVPPVATGPNGALMLALDPSGATVGFWQGARRTGVVLTDEPGASSGHELLGPSVSALAFYRRLFPFDVQVEDGALHATIGGRAAFSIHDSAPGAAHWRPVFGAADVSATSTHARELGASVLHAGAERALVRDPAGAVFVVRHVPAVGEEATRCAS